MPKTVELFYDFSSPNAYFAALMLPAIAARHGANIEYRPLLLGGLFKLLGTHDTPGALNPEKARYSLRDLERWGAKHGIEFRWASRFPLNTVKPMRLALVASELGLDERTLIERVFRAYWAEDRDITDASVLREIVSELGGDAGAALGRIEAPEVKDALRAATEAARARGVFGVPVCIVDDELFFGKDRLDFVEDALSQG
jgi:2-hydroxychromene-2-carboxylate isomerase